jgi:hypothetical protein
VAAKQIPKAVYCSYTSNFTLTVAKFANHSNSFKETYILFKNLGLHMFTIHSGSTVLLILENYKIWVPRSSFKQEFFIKIMTANEREITAGRLTYQN